MAVAEFLKDDVTKKMASLLHYAIYHVRNVQFFHRLRIEAKDLGTFSDIIALALKDYERLKDSGDDDLRDAAKFMVPSQDDIQKAQELFLEDPKKYISVLLARASAPCFKGRCRSGG